MTRQARTVHAATWMTALLLTGCVVDGNEDHAQCANGATRTVACGTFGHGAQEQVCVEFQWKNEGFCSDDSECVVGATQRVACGLNGRGEQVERCAEGRWAAAGVCEDPDLCVDSVRESLACGILNAGTQHRVCAHGQWQASPCEEFYDCEGESRDTQACGWNLRGTMHRGCVDNTWEDYFSACDDPDVCADGALEFVRCYDQMGLNGEKQRRQRCVNGQWSEPGPCEDPDACVNGATESVVCGSDRAGRQDRTCVSGQWTFSSPCYQTAQHVLSMPRGMLVLVAPPEHQSVPRMFGDNRQDVLAIVGDAGTSVVMPSVSMAPSPKKNNTTSARRFASSSTHACGISAFDKLFCWGSNAHGQLALPLGTEGSAQPVEVMLPDGNPTVAEVAVGEGFTCARTSNNRLYCWGRNDEAQLGVVPVAARHTPGRLLSGESVTRVVAGDAHACAVAKSSVYCWGRNTQRQASEQTAAVITAPTLHPSLSKYPGGGGLLGATTLLDLAAGANHTLVLWEKGAVLGLLPSLAVIGVGANDRGQLGSPTASSVSPATVLEEQSIPPLRRGAYDMLTRGNVTCIVQENGVQLRCMGANDSGALAASPASLFAWTDALTDLDPDGEGIVDIALGEDHLCVRLDASQRIRCRGSNAYGQLGDGTTTSRASSAYVLHASDMSSGSN